ncbi:MAG TPA: hypothetical protein VFA52_02420 [Candidatus Paceibacterota bacterium]|nr:hypothetical protein [Candidatus Paceibacterota bacterium]
MEAELQKLQAKIDEQQQKIDAMYQSVEKLRKYFMWTMIITIALFVLPLLGLVFAIPAFMHNYVDQINSISSF